MHILLIHQAFTTIDEPGGTRHHELSRYLAAKGQQITVITSPLSYLTGKQGVSVADQNAPDADQDGIKIIRSYAYPALHRSFFDRTINFISFMVSSFMAGLRVRQIDLVWGTSPPIFQAFTAWLLARLKGVPFLLEVRDLWPIFAIQVGVLKQPVLIKASEWLERFLYRHADCVMVNSPGFIEHVRTKGAKKVELVPNGSDTDMFYPQQGDATFRQENDLAGKYIVLYAGAHGMSNDLQIMLAAADQLRSDQRISFLLVGDGKEKPNLIQQAQELKLGNVHFLPPVPKKEMPQLISNVDACLAILKPIPMYATVYPNKVFDYMASGKPVILAIEGVMREVIEQAGAGIAVHPGDQNDLARAVKWLVENLEEGKRMGGRGRAYVEKNFDRNQLAERLFQLMQSLVKKVND